MEQKTALIIGASGLTGQVLLQALLADTSYSLVTIYLREQVSFNHPKLQKKIIDYEKLDTAVVADDVFCCLGTTIKKAGSQMAFRKVDLIYPQKVAELQRNAGSRKFLLISAVGANIHAPFFYSRIKGEVERAIIALDYPCTCIFRPSLIIGERSEHRAGESAAITFAKVIEPAILGPFKKYRPVSALSIAKAMQYAAHNYTAGVHIIPSDEIKKFE